MRLHPSRTRVDQTLAEEEKILEYLGAAVIMRWGTLPTKIQRELFAHAASLADLGQTVVLKDRLHASCIIIKMIAFERLRLVKKSCMQSSEDR